MSNHTTPTLNEQKNYQFKRCHIRIMVRQDRMWLMLILTHFGCNILPMYARAFYMQQNRWLRLSSVPMQYLVRGKMHGFKPIELTFMVNLWWNGIDYTSTHTLQAVNRATRISMAIRPAYSMHILHAFVENHFWNKVRGWRLIGKLDLARSMRSVASFGRHARHFVCVYRLTARCTCRLDGYFCLKDITGTKYFGTIHSRLRTSGWRHIR